MDLQRIVLAGNVMLRWCVDMELDESEVGSSISRGAVGDDFNSGSQVLELNGVDLGDIDHWLRRGTSDRSI